MGGEKFFEKIGFFEKKSVWSKFLLQFWSARKYTSLLAKTN